MSDDMPGLEEAVNAAVAKTMERNEYNGAEEITFLRREVWRMLVAAYPIIAKAVRAQVAAEIDARGLACDSFGGYEELIYRNAARIARGGEDDN
jgi:hypothetical protein